MRTSILLSALGLALGAFAASASSPAGGAATTVKILKQWKGGSSRKQDNNLWQAAPPGGVIAGPKAWAKLWQAWHPGQQPPAVDFSEELLLVAAGQGPNYIHLYPLTLDAGDLRFQWGITEKGGPGFVYRILKVSRAGIKTVNGKLLPAEPAASTPGDYLTADGRLKERLEVRLAHGGFAGFSGGYWVIEPDGSWSAGPIVPLVKGGKGAPTAKGKLTPAQLAGLAKVLARHDLAGLSTHGKPVVNSQVLTIQFGKRSVHLYDTGANQAVRERFQGVADAVRELCQSDKGWRPPRKPDDRALIR
jgi:hypothetical protein